MLPLFYFFSVFFALIIRYKKKTLNIRLVWGDAPIINNVYWSRAMKKSGYASETYTDSYCSTINKREDYDKILQEHFWNIPLQIKYYLGFFESLFKYDIFFISFSGYFLGKTPYWWLEHHLLDLSRKKVVVLPFGLDSYVYQRVRSTSLTHGLMMSIPNPARQQQNIGKKVDYWCAKADCVIPGVMNPDGFGRWDVLMPSSLHIDLDHWQQSLRCNTSDGHSQVVRIVHFPNHRGFKGTEFIISAINQLKEEGLLVELTLLEGKQNIEVRHTLQYEADILVEQIIATGHGLNGLEGMASGLPTISNLEDDDYILPIRRWSYFNECPIVSASPETLVDVLRKLVTRPELRKQLGQAGREYVEKYHGLDSAQYLFREVIEYIYGRRESLINLYHPILGEYPKRKPTVKHPLVNNKIVT